MHVHHLELNMATNNKSGYTHLRSTEKRTVVQVANYFKKKKKPMESIIRITVEATSVSRRTVLRIRKEFRETGKLASPKRPKHGPYKPVDINRLCHI